MRWWFFGLGRKRPPSRAQATPREQLRGALAELQERQQVAQKRKVKGRRHHTDEYRELVVDGAKNVNMTEALLGMAQDALSYKTGSEDPTRAELPTRRGPITDEASRVEAEKAAQEMGDEMKRLGISPDAHYYTPSERLQTGEVDRTYVVEDEEKRPDPPKKKA